MTMQVEMRRIVCSFFVGAAVPAAVTRV
jgi:hypothetical protein